MMFKILFSVFILINLCFGAFEKELEYFDKNFLTSKYNTQIKFHHQLKSFYIQSVINENEKEKIEVLKRLIISCSILNLDDTNYVNELKQSGMSDMNIDTLRQISTQEMKAQNAVFIPNNDEKLILTATKESSKKKYLLNSKQIQAGVELWLDFNLEKNDIKTIILDEKNNFRYIMDFEAILEGGKKDYKFDDFSITLSQYNPKTIRIVIRSKEKIPLNLNFNQKIFTILANQTQKTKNNSKEEPQKEQKTQTQTAQKKQEKPLYVLKTTKFSEGVSLNLNKDLNADELSVLNTKDNKLFRKIISFEGILEGGARNFNFGQQFITITQFNPKIVRIVLSSPKDFEFSKELKNKNLKIYFSNLNQENLTPSDKKTQEQSSKQNLNTNALNSNFKSGKIIVIDAGHGGKDSGALKGNLKEKDIVLNTALKIGNELKKRGYKVFYTRNKDKFINLRDRTKIANDKKADLFLSIHANAAASDSKAKTSEGLETFFLSPARSQRSKNAAEKENQGDFEEMNYFSKQSILNFLNREKIVSSNKLAIDIQKGVLSQTRKKYKIVDGGVREAPFWVLVGAQMPAILIEIGYITHPNEGKRIANKNFQELLARGVADGVDGYFYNNR